MKSPVAQEPSTCTTASLKRPQRGTLYLALHGLALTALLGAVLFCTVGLNKKDPAFGDLPWIYAGASLATSILLGLLAQVFKPQDFAEL